MKALTGKQKKELRMIVLAAALFFIFLILQHTAGSAAGNALSSAAGIPAGTAERIVFFLLFLIPYCIVGLPVFRKAVLGIGHGQWMDECFLMALATVGAFATGENAEACAVMLFYQIGEFFQRYAVGQSRKQISELMEIAPETANLIGEDGSVSEEDPEDIEEGSLLLVRPGEKIPIDGIVVSGESMIGTAALTGEPVPRHAAEGDAVISGCVNGEGTLRIRTTKRYEDSTVARILELVENASSRKSKTENFITRFARYYTPAVVAGALALALIPPLFGGRFGEWVMRACTFLVISCPCALVISVPLSFFGGIGAASRRGILVKGSNYLEQLSYLDMVVSDKTGTLTEGRFAVRELRGAEGVSEEELLQAAAFAEHSSTHPIALSILEAYGKAVPDDRIRKAAAVSGRGVSAETEDGTILAGSRKYLEENGIPVPEDGPRKEGAAGTRVFVSRDGRYLGEIFIADRIKEGAAEAIAQLSEAGVSRFVMLTGDSAESARSVSSLLGITEERPELLPDGKVEAVEGYLSAYEKTRKTLAFVGDGINDAPVLSRADVGIAMGSLGSDAAIEAADVVIMDDDLRKIPLAVRIAKKTMRIARENIVFALGVKLLILILGALGLAGMWLAVFADVGVAFIAILNAMRAMRCGR